MKKKIIAVMIGALAAASITGCGEKLSNEYVTVKRYKSLEIPQVEEIEVKDEDVEQVIQNSLNAKAERKEITDRAAKNGDIVNIDYTGYIDGEAFDGGSAKGTDLELGAGRFIGATEEYKGFEEQIEGHKKGEKFDITVQFPEGYQDPTKDNVVAKFHIVLNGIYEQNIPELTDEWVKENSEESKTVDEFKEEVRKQMEDGNKESMESEKKASVQEALFEQIEVKKYPDGEVDEQVEQAKEYYTSIAELYGMELGEFVTVSLQTTEEDFDAKIKEAAEKTVAVDTALKLIAKKEKLEPTEKEYEDAMAEYAEKAGVEDVDSYKEQAGEETLKTAILREKVTDYLIEHCIQVEQSDAGN